MQPLCNLLARSFGLRVLVAVAGENCIRIKPCERCSATDRPTSLVLSTLTSIGIRGRVTPASPATPPLFLPKTRSWNKIGKVRRLLHRSGRTGLSRPLPGSYWFFPVGMPCLSPRAHDGNRRDSSSHHSHKHRHLMRTITGITVDSALHQLAFRKSTPKYSCSRLRSCFSGSLHLAANQSKSFFGHSDGSAIWASTTFGPFPTSDERLNTHRTVAAQRFSSIHF